MWQNVAKPLLIHCGHANCCKSALADEQEYLHDQLRAWRHMMIRVLRHGTTALTLKHAHYALSFL